MFHEISDHEYSNLFGESNPAPIAAINGSRFWGIPGPADDQETYILADPGDGNFFIGKFDPAEYANFRADLASYPPEELLLKYGPPDVRAAYFGASLN